MAQTLGNPNRQGPFGNTLLHSAVAGGDLSEVQRLLSAGANPRIANREGHTALRVAVLLGHDEIYRALAKRGEDHSSACSMRRSRRRFPPAIRSPSPRRAVNYRG